MVTSNWNNNLQNSTYHSKRVLDANTQIAYSKLHDTNIERYTHSFGYIQYSKSVVFKVYKIDHL